ncbi:MAG: glucose 1-dehydrogenase [Dehalococcoidia bacterium]|nr:glucose 1-dehydrogenase [Dehalococcoidia bacterium]
MTARLSGKVAMITGGANGVRGQLMGFGGAFAWIAAREGASVVVTDVDEESGSLTAAQISETGAPAMFVRLDVTSASGWHTAIDTAVGTYGRLDVLVNGAGVHALYDVESTPEDEWNRAMAVHATGTFLGIKLAAPVMRRGGGGSIINVSSIAAMTGSPSNTAYHAAKGAILSLTKAAAIQLAGAGIRVNSLHPGYADTPFTVAPFSEPGALERRLSKVPMGRLGTAEEIANAVLYLASDESSYVTGAELVVDGGFLAQ